MRLSHDKLQDGHPYRRRDTATVRPPRVEAASLAVSPLARLLLAGLILLGVWLFAIAWREHRLNGAVSALPPAAQQQAYRRAYDELATTCAAQPELETHCSEEAEFIRRLPQCTDDCRTLTRRYFPVATK